MVEIVNATFLFVFSNKYFCSELFRSKFFFPQESMKNLRDSLPSWIDSDRAAAVGSLKVRFKFRIQSYMLIAFSPHGTL